MNEFRSLASQSLARAVRFLELAWAAFTAGSRSLSLSDNGALVRDLAARADCGGSATAAGR